MKLSKSAVERLVEEMSAADLGDPRRTRRLQQVVSGVAEAASSSLPMSLGSDAELQGCYRLVNNEAVTFEKVLAAHANATKKRAEQAGRVLVLHDTTTCSFPNLPPEEVGYLPTGKAGFLLHPALVLDARAWRRPLGVIHAEYLVRDKPTRRKRKKKASGSETAKWPDRESQRWWRGAKASGEALAGCESVIHVADREGDSYELLSNMLAAEQRLVIRVKVDRRGRKTEEAIGWSTVKQLAASCEGVLERDVPLSRRRAKSAPGMNRANPPRKARLARLHFAATSVAIPRPQYLHDPVPAELRLNLVRVWEANPTPGEPAVEWLLYSTEPIETADQVAEIVDIYRARWTIEEFNAALKTGCAYEAREFQSLHALLAMLAVSIPIACEILALRSLARTAPASPASAVLNPVQIQVLSTIGSRRLPASPTALDALLAVAALGGHLKRNGPPGWLVLQRGMTQMLTYEAGWRAGQTATRGSKKM